MKETVDEKEQWLSMLFGGVDSSIEDIRDAFDKDEKKGEILRMLFDADFVLGASYRELYNGVNTPKEEDMGKYQMRKMYLERVENYFVNLLNNRKGVNH